MLNVPESVKALFKQDGIRKNFRVHFPGGELPDITNDNVVQESVRFTESLCSQDVLKFGLTEASVLEFETVGVANMYGMTIEAGIEIDLSSMSAAELAEIEAGSWDGVYVSESDTDLSFPFFRVPYGVFRVESCPRDHQAMTHRKVQAYGKMSEILKLSPLEEKKLAAYLADNKSFDASLMNLLYANIGYYNPDMLAEAGFEKETINFTQTTSNITVTAISKSTFSSKSCTFRLYFNNRIVNEDSLLCFEVGDYSYDSILTGMDELDSRYTIRDVSYPNAPTRSFRDLLSWLLSSSGENCGVSGYIPYAWEDNQCFYPYRGSASGNMFSVKYLTRVYFSEPNSGWSKTYYATNDSDVILSRYQYSGEDLIVKINSTLQSTITQFGQTQTAYAYVNSFSFSALLNGFLELHAMFGKLTRAGTYEQIRLSNSSPAAVAPGEYSGFWWDEYDVLPIGSVTYDFTDSETQSQTNTYEFGEGESTYDMTQNEVLSKLSTADVDTINDMLGAQFIPHLDPIAFTPIDLEMKGLPYIEAGDYLAVTAEDGTIAYSFNMRQTINGIQVLTAEIESTSGDIIESEEGET